MWGQVALQSCAMTNCGLILESILQAASDFVSEAEEALFMSRCFSFALRWGPWSHTVAECAIMQHKRALHDHVASCGSAGTLEAGVQLMDSTQAKQAVVKEHTCSFCAHEGLEILSRCI